MSDAPRTSEGPADPSFEASTARLADVVEELERGDLPLEKALALFEEGVRLSRAAQARLDRAERRVEELLAIDPKGAPVTRPVTGYAAGGEVSAQGEGDT